MDEKAAYNIRCGLCWLGFWIGLGLYNFQGCSPQTKTAIEMRHAWDEGSKK